MELLGLAAMAYFAYAMIDAVEKSSKQYKKDKANGVKRHWWEY